MTAGAHDAGGGFGRSAGTNAARGVLVIVAAVAVGLLLMFRGLSDSNDIAASGDDVAVADDTVEPTEDGATTEGTDGGTATTAETAPPVETTTTVADAPRDPSEVKVLVLNGTDPVVGGIAGKGTDVLKPFNYITLDPKNADVPGPSAIYYTEGYQAEANAVAAAFGADPAAVVQPFDPAASPVADTQGANVIVRVGSDGVIKV